jgi:glycosyltransferase involved in cell wall biosynthesis
MTRLAEQSRADPDPSVGSRSWRAEVAVSQEQALPSGRVVVSCSAPLGVGGLGRHLRELVDALDRSGQPTVCICGSDRAPSTRRGYRRVFARTVSAALSVPPLRLAAARRELAYSREFDSYAARRLPAADHLIAFNGTALEQTRVVRRERGTLVSLVSATSHFAHVARQHARAHRQYPIEGSWARGLVKRNVREYAEADRIYVASEYVRESFIEEGFPDHVLASFPLTPDPRYEPDPAPRSSPSFDVVYVGTLSVVKGVPLLIDAISALPHADIRLVLVGGWKSRAMHRYIERACAADSRIHVGLGEPFSALRTAALHVHPSYNDGFAYAPAEALACGVPVIVSEDTGMKDLIEPGRNGVVLPTGDLGALTEAIEAAYRGELFNG